MLCSLPPNVAQLITLRTFAPDVASEKVVAVRSQSLNSRPGLTAAFPESKGSYWIHSVKMSVKLRILGLINLFLASALLLMAGVVGN